MGNTRPIYLALTLTIALGGCMRSNHDLPEVHGHRGCRGLLPENTVPAFEEAAKLGCQWLEMDVVITGDGHVLVSHEPWMEHRICRTPEGDTITADRERDFNIYRMTLEEVQAFDCGSRVHPGFPDQEPRRLSKPTLDEVVTAIEELAMEEGFSNIGYNIEIKSEPALYDKFQPNPHSFAERVIATIDSLGIGNKVIIQSFDPAVLEAVHDIDQEIPVALLIDNGHDLPTNLARLTFKPDYYSPAQALVDAALVRALDQRDIGLLVWTVNEEADMRRLIKLGANGIITDYPDKLIKILDEDQ
jgi:glycerophosphoryl diester phosphodiesterase